MTVDLGRAVQVSGAGLTSKDGGTVSLDLSANGRDWTHRGVDAPAGGPAYVKADTRAREWVPGVGWQPGAGTPNDNLTLFDFHGHAMPSIAIFEDPVRSR